MAKKIRLNVDELSVQSYATGEQVQPHGTVHAHLTWSDPRVCAHSEDWHCTVNEVYCTAPNACNITASDPAHECDV